MRKQAFLIFILFTIQIANAQVVDGNDNSPYTQVGVGDLSPSGFSRNLGMANTGVSMTSKYYINNINPALLADTKLTLFEFGLQFRIRLLNATESSQRNFGGNFNYVSLAFPLSKKLTMAAGFKPFSTLRYSNNTTYPISGDTLNYSTGSNGQGSISQVFLSTGYEISSNVSVGVSAGFLFGKIAEETNVFTGIPVTYGYTNNYTRVVLNKNTVLNGYNLQGGILYRKRFLADDMRLNVGFTGSFANTFNANTSNYLQKRSVSSSSDNTYLTDTLIGSANKINLPSTFVLGTSINKAEEWSVGTDFTLQTFGDQTFRNPNGSLQNAFRWSLGGEFNPLFLKKKSYFTRIIYRAGVYAGRTQYNFNGNSINDMGVTVGFGIPLGKLFSYANFSCQIGSRGTTNFGLIREDYFNFNLGLNVNDKWFIRPKVD